jgi:hypothetical protein
MRIAAAAIAFVLIGSSGRAALIVTSDPPAGFYPVVIDNPLEYSARDVAGGPWQTLPDNRFAISIAPPLTVENFTFELLHGGSYTRHVVALEYWLGESPAVITPGPIVLMGGEKRQRFVYHSGGDRVVFAPLIAPEPSAGLLAAGGFVLIGAVRRRLG